MCADSVAGVGDRNVYVRCEVRAKPEVVHLRWIIDDNGTTVAEGQVVNEYWTLVMVSGICLFNLIPNVIVNR